MFLRLHRLLFEFEEHLLLLWIFQLLHDNLRLRCRYDGVVTIFAAFDIAAALNAVNRRRVGHL